MATFLTHLVRVLGDELAQLVPHCVVRLAALRHEVGVVDLCVVRGRFVKQNPVLELANSKDVGLAPDLSWAVQVLKYSLHPMQTSYLIATSRT
jgi:hypothetical protein